MVGTTEVQTTHHFPVTLISIELYQLKVKYLGQLQSYLHTFLWKIMLTFFCHKERDSVRGTGLCGSHAKSYWVTRLRTGVHRSNLQQLGRKRLHRACQLLRTAEGSTIYRLHKKYRTWRFIRRFVTHFDSSFHTQSYRY